MDRTSVRLFRGNGLFAVGVVMRAVGAKIRKGVAGTGLFAVIGVTICQRLLLPERATAIMMAGATEDANADFFPEP